MTSLLKQGVDVNARDEVCTALYIYAIVNVFAFLSDMFETFSMMEGCILSKPVCSLPWDKSVPSDR